MAFVGLHVGVTGGSGHRSTPGEHVSLQVLQLPLPLACCLKEQREQKPRFQMLLISIRFSSSAVVPVTVMHTCRGMHTQVLLSSARSFCSATLKLRRAK